ncbi:MAG: RluA family pseudouridine synthase [Candidatus Muiribacteriota bacterium]
MGDIYKVENEIYQGDNIRIDLFLKKNLLSLLSRAKIQEIIREEKIKVNGKSIKTNYVMKSGDKYSCDYIHKNPDELVPEKVDFEIVYEDEWIIIVNKPRGLVVHPASSVKDPTLVHGLLFKKIPLAPVSKNRPGIVHRIDRYTSGIVIIVKTVEAYDKFTLMFKNKKILKKYRALCYNNFKYEKGIIDMPIGRSQRDRKKMTVRNDGKQSITSYEVIKNYGGYSFVEVDLKTGRTHQIRVHLARCGHPVVGDGVYGPQKNDFSLTGQFLHAGYIGFEHPFLNKWMSFSVPLPEELENILRGLGND